MKTKRLILFLIILQSFICLNLKAQTNSVFNSFLILSKLKYQEPKGFREDSLKKSIAFQRTAKDRTSLILKLLSKDKDNIMLGITLIPIIKPNELSTQVLTIMGTPMDINKSYIRTAKLESNDQYFNRKQLDSSMLSELHADDGFIYQLSMTNLFLNKFDCCKVLILHKNDVADAQLFFFYMSKNEERINDILNKSCCILKFD